MREYELTVVYDLAVQEAGGPDAGVQQLTTAVEARGGKVIKVDHWGRRRMAYPINRMIDGDYVVTRIELEPTSVSELEANLTIDEKVFRHLIVRADELPVPPPPREPRREPGTPAPVADVTGVPEVPATPADALALGEAEASPAPVPSSTDVGEGEAPASGTIAPAVEDVPAEEAGAEETAPAMPAAEPAAPAAAAPEPALTADEAIANAAEETEAATAPVEAAAAPPMAEETLANTTPQSSTTGYTSDAAEVNSGVDVTDEDATKPTGPHTEPGA